jgi:hypothetical protein
LRQAWCGLLFLTVLCSCVTTRDMAIDREGRSINLVYESIVLMTIELVHNEEPRFVPDPFALNVEAASGVKTTERLVFHPDTQGAQGFAHQREIFILRLALKPGVYHLTRFGGEAAEFPYRGTFTVPLDILITVPPHAVVYVGRIVATTRPTRENEIADVRFGLGAMSTMIYRANFDVALRDEQADDVPMIRRQFRALASLPIMNGARPDSPYFPKS